MIKIEYKGNIDYYDIFVEALASGGTIEIGSGKFVVSGTLKVRSDTTIIAHPDTVIYTADNSKRTRYDFLLTNEDWENGNENIVISGGIWEGNCLNNRRGKLFGGGYTGSMLNFFNVTNLRLENMEMRNPECYYVRISRCREINIKNIFFNSDVIRPNQDGIHLAGDCENVCILNLRGSYGSPNDDFVALNADDCLTRLQNLDVVCGAIRNVVIENLHSEYCHSFVRMLSVNSPIENVMIRSLKGKCKAFAVNMDGARYCKPGTRLLKRTDKRYFRGCGDIRNVRVHGLYIFSAKRQKALILAESNIDDMEITDFSTGPKFCNTPALSTGYNHPLRITVTDKSGTGSIYDKPYYRRVKLKAEEYARIKIDKHLT